MHSEREVGLEYGKMIGDALIPAIAAITGWLKSLGTVLTPMMPVGRSARIASTNDATGGWSWANGFWKSARSPRDETRSPLTSKSQLRARPSAIGIPSSAIASLMSSAMPVAAAPPPRKRNRWSVSCCLEIRSAPKIPASATAAVPWMSSL